MLYDGKTPEELTNEELYRAAELCVKRRGEYETALIELTLEYERRLPCNASRLN
jgi:hypothetical protein